MKVWKAVTWVSCFNMILFTYVENWPGAIGFALATIFAAIIAKEC